MHGRNQSLRPNEEAALDASTHTQQSHARPNSCDFDSAQEAVRKSEIAVDLFRNNINAWIIHTTKQQTQIQKTNSVSMQLEMRGKGE